MDDADRAQCQIEMLDELRAKQRVEPLQVSSGYCVDCDEAIDPARLRAVPFAQRCIYCQTEYDGRGRLYG